MTPNHFPADYDELPVRRSWLEITAIASFAARTVLAVVATVFLVWLMAVAA